jgi:RimJ/RimL family protein N-acetyltransferase
MTNQGRQPAAQSVTLRDTLDSDLPILYEFQLDPEATRMAAFPARDRAAFMAHWRRILNDESTRNRIILADGAVAGSISTFEMDGRREVGYWIGREFWGRGVATQALAALLAEEPVRPIYAHVAKHNIASRRVLEKCGFVIDSEDTGFPDEDGNPVEEFVLVLRGDR